MDSDLKSQALANESIALIYTLCEIFDRFYIEEDTDKEKLICDIINISDYLPMGGTLIIDLKNIKFVSPGVLKYVLKKTKEEAGKRGYGLFFGKHIAVKDPNEDLEIMLRLLLKDEHPSVSLIIAQTDQDDEKIVIDEYCVNLPCSLEKTFCAIKANSPISSSKLIEIFEPQKPTNVRERLRQLYRRGLVKRKAMGTVGGKHFFIYEIFRVEPLLPKAIKFQDISSSAERAKTVKTQRDYDLSIVQ